VPTLFEKLAEKQKKKNNNTATQAKTLSKKRPSDRSAS